MNIFLYGKSGIKYPYKLMESTITVVVIDDSFPCIALLQSHLEQFSNIQIVGTASNAAEGRKLILNKKPKLVFLDIMMPHINGLELLHLLQDKITWSMQTIIVSAYPNYADEAIRKNVFDYLSKPISIRNLRKSIDRFVAITEQYIGLHVACNAQREVLVELQPGQTSMDLSKVFSILTS